MHESENWEVKLDSLNERSIGGEKTGQIISIYDGKWGKTDANFLWRDDSGC